MSETWSVSQRTAHSLPEFRALYDNLLIIVVGYGVFLYLTDYRKYLRDCTRVQKPEEVKADQKLFSSEL